MQRALTPTTPQERFRAAVAALTGMRMASGTTANGCPADIPKIGLAVSGGPDSIAMLLLAECAWPGKIAAATVDHGLRPGSAGEAAYVADLCAARGIAHHILRPPQAITGNLQSSARRVRYALLRQWADENGCRWIATAHHADDQLETMLMRLARGSAAAGLSGIRQKNGRIIRPLLQFTKAELTGICAQAGVQAIADPSNDNRDFDRVRMRQWLARGDHPLSPSAAVNSAAALAEAEAALAWTAKKLAQERITQSDDAVIIDPAGLPAELARRMILAAVALLSPRYRARGPAITRLHGALLAGEQAMIGDIVCSGGKLWRFRPAPPRNIG